MPRRVLVACVGNIFLGDDGFGVAVAQRLHSRSYSPCVHVVDFGIRGVELAYTLLDGYETLVLVGAAVALLVLQIPDIKREIRLWTM